jgi:hypothetical protein
MKDVLIDKSAFLAHCFLEEGGNGNTFSAGRNLFERIDDCFNNKLELPCSTIHKGDTLIYLGRTNFFGPVGIILEPGIITYASSVDGGTSVDKYSERVYPSGWTPPATKTQIEQAITERHDNSHNEFFIKDYSVCGLFITFDDREFLLQNIGSEEKFYEKTKHLNVNYYFLQKGELFLCEFDNASKQFFNGKGPVSISDLYSD